MKYRLFEGGYEGFLDDRVPAEYKNIVVDKLPQEITDVGITMQQEGQEKAEYIAAMPDLVRSLEIRIAALEAP